MPTKKSIFGIAAIIFITFLIYLPAILGGFVWDDSSFLTHNPLIRAADGLERFWFSTEPPDYFPLTSTTLWLEWRLWGMNPLGYHITNVLLHILCSLLLWAVLNRLKVPGAWFASFLFAIHPVNVEAVAWITQRKTVLPMVFYLLSILAYLKFEKTGKPRDYIFSLGTFLLALLSKTSVIMLPFVLLGCAWWQRGRIEGKDLRRTIPFFASSLLLSLITIWFQYNRSIGDDIVRVDGFFSRLAGAGWAVWFYLYKTLFPLTLCFVYPRWKIDAASWISYLPGAILLGLLLLFWKYRKNWGRPFLFGTGYFAVTLFPMLGFFNIYYMRYSLVADHYQYQSMIGILALAAGLGTYEFQKLKKNSRRWATAAFSLLCGLLCFQTWTLGQIYKNPETLFLDTLRKNPGSWMANYNLGRSLQDDGKYDEAMRYYDAALRADPSNPDPLNNTGNILLAAGKVDEAKIHFMKAISMKPDFGEGYYNMGCALLETGAYSEAVDYFNKSLRIHPQNEKAHNNLANALATQGRFNQALAHYREALRLKPRFVDAHVNLGIVLKRQQQYDEARKHFSEALRLQPDNEKARKNLAALTTPPPDTTGARS